MRSWAAWSGGSAAELPEVVFLPGMGARGYLLPWAREVAAWTRVTVLDLPGWWWGRARHCPPTIDGVAVAVRDWMIDGELSDAVLVGHSTGAQAAARAAAMVSDRLCGTVLGGPVFDPAIRGVGTLLRRAASTAPAEVPSEVAAMLPSFLHSGGLALFRLLREGLRYGASGYPFDVGRAAVITGERDRLAPPWWAKNLARRLGARCHVVPGGHNFVYRYPREASEVLRTTALEWRAAPRCTWPSGW